MSITTSGTLTLIGSGELGPSMKPVHRAIARRLSGTVSPVFLDTPAGFEPNVGDIASRASAYVEKVLGVPCEIGSFTDGSTATEREHALGVLRSANYIFAGPGSPSYAVRLLRGSPAIDLVAERLSQGAHIVCASAAAIALGTVALPVYEIYKAGADLHWLEGLDVLGRSGIRLAVVPHWNNTEGGTHDTRCCFMGRERFDRLASMLDVGVIILGIDEHTACTLDFNRGECTVMGAGAITVLRNGRERQFVAGDGCPIDALRGPRVGSANSTGNGRPPAQAAGIRERLIREMTRASEVAARGDGLTQMAARAFALAGEVDAAPAAGIDQATVAEGRAVLSECVRALSRQLGDDAGGDSALTAQLLDLLIGVRARLRTTGDWALADTIRDGLASLGVVVEDNAEGTRWRLQASAERGIRPGGAR